MNPALGVFFHWLGGLASASFYVPYRGVKHWAWETYWLVGGFFSWIIAPWILALTMTHNLMGVLHEAPASSLLWAYIFGVLSASLCDIWGCRWGWQWFSDIPRRSGH
jgi:L-rhamnose-H+ transport protein